MYDILVITGYDSEEDAKKIRDIIIAIISGANTGNVKVVERKTASVDLYTCNPNPGQGRQVEVKIVDTEPKVKTDVKTT